MSSAEPEDYHVVVFLDADGKKMMSYGTSSESADRIEAKIRSGSFGSMGKVTFVERQFRDAAWRKAHVAP